MTLNLEDDSAIKRYLLGELTEEDQQALEERLMTDSGYFERLQLLEDELVDDYARGTLTPGEETKFDSFFLRTPDRCQKLRFASALKRYVSTATPAKDSEPVRNDPRVMSSWQLLKLSLFGRNPLLGYSLAAALLLIVLGGAWSVDRYRRLQDQVEGITTQNSITAEELARRLGEQRARSAQLAEELEHERRRRALLEQAPGALNLKPAPLPIVSFVLTPGLVRGSASTNRVTVSSDTSLISLQLPTTGVDYKSYRAGLYNDNHAEILIRNMLKASADKTVVVLNLPAETVSQGDYYVKLTGITSDGDTQNLGNYHFRVIKPQLR